ncbi:MAG: hypothetical protein ACRD8W_01610, partial [Nitrososphaeraceae archaeon]
QWHPIPITAGKQPPKNCSWANRRGTIASQPFLEEYFCNNQIVQRLAILLDSKKLGFALDIDGLDSLYIFQRKIVPRYSLKVQEKINSTTQTRSANGGYHWLFEVLRNDFPTGIVQGTYWTSKTDSHEEIKVIGSNQYLIERGTGYVPVRGIESVVILSKDESNELLNGLAAFEEETKMVISIGTKIIKYYYRSNRQNVALRVAGYLHRHHIPEYLTRYLIEYVVDTTKDEEANKRFQAIRDTYVKDPHTDQVSGRMKLLEMVDGDESVVTVIHENFAKLGYHFNANGNGNRNSIAISKWQPDLIKEQNEGKKCEQVQKYSNDDLLAEAIIIAGKPHFAVVSPDGIRLVEEIPSNNSRKTILRPLDLDSYINKPYTFKSQEEFKDYIERARKESLDSLYQQVKSIWKKYIDADDFHISLCAADTIFTYYQDVIGMTHYLFFVGDNDSGKSNNLVVLHFLAYRNMMSVGMSVANIYQFLGGRDEGVGTVCEDEADNVEDDHDKMQIAKSGYTKGYPVTKIVITPYGRIQIKYNSFCFKAYAAEKSPDLMKAKGLIQRIIKLACTAGLPNYDILEVTNPAGDEKLQTLLNELLDVRNVLFCHRLLHHDDTIPDIKLNLTNRENQLFKPLLKLFQGTKTFEELLLVLSKYVNERRENKIDSYHAYLYNLVRRLLDKENTNEIPSNTIWSEIKDELEGGCITSHPLSYDTADFGVLSQKGVTETLIDVFGANPSKGHAGGRKLIFNRQKLDRLKNVYYIKEIKIEQEGDATTYITVKREADRTDALG